MDVDVATTAPRGVLTIRADIARPADELGQSLRLVRNVLRLGAELPRIVRPTGVELAFARPVFDNSALHVDVRLTGNSAGAVARTLDITSHVLDLARATARRFPARFTPDAADTAEVEELLELAGHASVRATGPALRERVADQLTRIASSNGVSTIIEAATRGLTFTTRSWRRLDSNQRSAEATSS
jgi:hypothetical protein